MVTSTPSSGGSRRASGRPASGIAGSGASGSGRDLSRARDATGDIVVVQSPALRPRPANPVSHFEDLPPMEAGRVDDSYVFSPLRHNATDASIPAGTMYNPSLSMADGARGLDSPSSLHATLGTTGRNQSAVSGQTMQGEASFHTARSVAFTIEDDDSEDFSNGESEPAGKKKSNNRPKRQ